MWQEVVSCRLVFTKHGHPSLKFQVSLSLPPSRHQQAVILVMEIEEHKVRKVMNVRMFILKRKPI
jgi:hypothetical protein